MEADDTKIRVFACVFLVCGIGAIVMFFVSFSTTEWLHFPNGTYSDLAYTISFGLWNHQWCVQGICGIGTISGYTDLYSLMMDNPGNTIRYRQTDRKKEREKERKKERERKKEKKTKVGLKRKKETEEER